MKGGWRKLHNEELHNLSSSPCIFKAINPRGIRCIRHVAFMGVGGIHIQVVRIKGISESIYYTHLWVTPLQRQTITVFLNI
jgi:hypothetical protein